MERRIRKPRFAITLCCLTCLWPLRPEISYGYQLQADALSSLAGEGAASEYALGFTSGLPVMGQSAAAGYQFIAGFWFPVFGDTPSSLEDELLDLPAVTRLNQVFPNPFALQTTVRFQIGAENDLGPVRFEIFDVAGRSIRVLVNEPLPQGRYSFEWDGADARDQRVSGGVYFGRFMAGSYTKSMRLIVR